MSFADHLAAPQSKLCKRKTVDLLLSMPTFLVLLFRNILIGTQAHFLSQSRHQPGSAQGLRQHSAVNTGRNQWPSIVGVA